MYTETNLNKIRALKSKEKSFTVLQNLIFIFPLFFYFILIFLVTHAFF